MSTARADVRAPRSSRCRPHTRGLVWSLGLGAFGLAFSITTTAAYLPPVLRQLHRLDDDDRAGARGRGRRSRSRCRSSSARGATRSTRRSAAAARSCSSPLGPIGFCLALMAFMPNLWTTALLVFAFFFAYYIYEPPYRGLYPDVLPARVFGQAQGVQHMLRGLAIGGALVGGGFLFHAWKPGAVPGRGRRDDARVRRMRRARARAGVTRRSASSAGSAATCPPRGACCARSAT